MASLQLSPSASYKSARQSYLAIFYIHRRLFSSSVKRFSISSFNGSFTGVYEPGQPTRGPLSEASNHGVPRLTPKKLKEHLDAFVVGQERSKKYMAVTVYNHYQRISEIYRLEELERERNAKYLRERYDKIGRHPVEGYSHDELTDDRADLRTPTDEYPGQIPTVDMDDPTSLNSLPRRLGEAPIEDTTQTTIEKSNVIMIGPTGVGKTLMAKTLARVLEVPFSMSDCTPFTQAGYIGEDAEVCVHRLLAAADFDVARAEHGIIYLDEVDKLAAARVTHGKDVSGEGVQQALLKIIEGTTITVTAKAEKKDTPAFGSGYTGGPIGGAAGKGPPKTETYQIRTDNILFIFSGAFVGLDKIILNRVSRSSMGFGAQVRARPSHNDPSAFTNLHGIDPAEFHKALPFYDPPPAPTSSTDQNSAPAVAPEEPDYNILDLATPADFQTYGLIPEFTGRIPITTALSPLSHTHLVRILTEPRSSLVAQYTALFATYGVELRFTTASLHSIASAAVAQGTGARGLRTVMEKVLVRSMYETPGTSIRYVLVTRDAVAGKCQVGYWGRGQKVKFSDVAEAEEEVFRREKEGIEEEREGGVVDFKEFRAQASSGL